MPLVSEIHLDVTSRCNLRCAYCYYYGEHDAPAGADPPAERLKWIMDEAAALGCGEVTLTGGEPLLREDIVDLVAHGDSLKTLLTNGTLLARGLVRELDRLGGRIKEVKVSLDGFAGHDRVRGEGSSARILRGLQLLEESRIPYVINTMISSSNLGDLPQLYQWIKGSSCYRWAIDVPAPLGRARDNRGVYALYDGTLFAALRGLVERFLADGMPFCINLMNIFHSELLAPYIEGHAAEVRQEEVQQRFAWTGDDDHPCSYYVGGFSVRVTGEVGFCPSLPLAFGDISDRPLADIVTGESYREFARLRVADVEPCARCRYRRLCGTGCRADALLRTGDLRGVDASACQRMLFFERELLPLLPERAREFILGNFDQAGVLPRPGAGP
jgi:radical SAM protein with 4Fe4S-binding SPASM domain